MSLCIIRNGIVFIQPCVSTHKASDYIKYHKDLFDHRGKNIAYYNYEIDDNRILSHAVRETVRVITLTAIGESLTRKSTRVECPHGVIVYSDDLDLAVAAAHQISEMSDDKTIMDFGEHYGNHCKLIRLDLSRLDRP